MDPLAYIERNQAKMVKRLQEMVRLPTTNPPGRNYDMMVGELSRYCTKLGMKVVIHRVADSVVEAAGVDPSFPRLNLLARWDVGAPRTVHFNAHYDVVPAAGEWRQGGAFEAKVAGGWLYGRGSGDMKGSIAALLAAIEALVMTRSTPAFNIECSFTADEETGGWLGAGHIVREGLVNADYAVVCEGASAARVGLGHNGVLWLEVSIRGKSAHASNPQQGVNAFEMMADLVHYLRPLGKRLAVLSRRYTDFSGQVRNPTVNVGGVFAGSGQKVNTVPGNAVFTVDRRIPPNERLTHAEGELRRAIAKAAARVAGIRYSVRSILKIDPCVMDAEHALPSAFSKSVRYVRRGPSGFGVTTGFTDLHYFIEEGGLPGIGYGVGGQRAHGADERVGLRELVQTARTYAHFMLRDI